MQYTCQSVPVKFWDLVRCLQDISCESHTPALLELSVVWSWDCFFKPVATSHKASPKGKLSRNEILYNHAWIEVLPNNNVLDLAWSTGTVDVSEIARCHDCPRT